MSSDPITRRRLLGAGLGVGAAGLLAGCATPGSTNANQQPLKPAVQTGQPVTITYWAWLKDLQKVCDVWNAKKSHIRVQANWIPGGTGGGYQKMHAAVAAGGGPDIAQVELREIPEFVLANNLVDLARYGARDYQSRYDPAAWKQVSYAGSVYGLPQDTGPVAFYYQTALLDRFGGEPPKTWTDWRELAHKVRSAGKGAYLEVFPVSDSSPFACFAQQAGANWFRIDGDEWVVSMADKATLEVAKFFDGCIDDGLVDTSAGGFSPGWYASAAAGRIVATTTASWGDALIQSVQGGKGKWRVAPMPRWSGGFGSGELGGSSAAVLANSPHPREALEFILWMTTSKEGVDAMIKYCGIGWSPSKDYIGAEREKPSAWFSGQNYNTDVFKPAARDQNLAWTWGPLTEVTFTALQDEFRRKITSHQTLVDSVHKAQDQVVKKMRAQGLRVRVTA